MSAQPESVRMQFHRRIADALSDSHLRQSLAAVRDKFTAHRAAAVDSYYKNGGDFESLREFGKNVRDESMRCMPELLAQFEKNAAVNGTRVLWAKDAKSARRLIGEIAAHHGIKTAVKSKSMATEEIALNDSLQKNGAEVVETDLGEFIIQLAKEPPSHIIAPAMHKSRQEVAAVMQKSIPCEGDDIASLTRAARLHLRQKFQSAELGISGANFLVADCGAAVIVTNEGNGRFCTTLPSVHITVAGIDKIIPRHRDLSAMLTLLARSATGQKLSNYVSITNGSRRDNDSEGPAHAYVILLDNGRSALRQSDCRDMLRCIRCGACMNHCPVYHTIGGHAYNAEYMGPMGQVLIPALRGLSHAPDLPHATTMCGACAVVCPVKIPLPDLMRRLRRRQMQQKLRPRRECWLLAMWLFAARRPRVYAFAAAAACRILSALGGPSHSDNEKQINKIPLFNKWFGGWFDLRSLRAPSNKPFRAQLQEWDL